MKRLIKLIGVAVALVIAPLLITASASAQQSTCEIGYTGPNSENMCTISYKCSVDVENSNSVKITDSTGQEAASGNVSNSGNNSGGNSTSGTVTNTNGTVFNVTIINASEEAPETCTASRTVPATVTPTPTTPTPSGQGQVQGAAVVLPATTADNEVQLTALIASAVFLTIALAVSAVLWYRQRKML